MIRLLLVTFIAWGCLFSELSLSEQMKSGGAKPTLIELSDWHSIQEITKDTFIPIVLLIEQSNCQFCEQIKEHFLLPLIKTQRFNGRVLFRTLNIDEGLSSVISQAGNAVVNRSFCQKFDACFTPTILFLDSNQSEVAERIVGFNGSSYYGYYLEQSIVNSVNANAQVKKYF